MEITRFNAHAGMYVIWTPFAGNKEGGVFQIMGGYKTKGKTDYVLIKKAGHPAFDAEVKKLRMATLEEIKRHVGY